jgi:hypothetical protein
VSKYRFLPTLVNPSPDAKLQKTYQLFLVFEYDLDQLQIWEHAPEFIEAIWGLEKSQLEQVFVY